MTVLGRERIEELMSDATPIEDRLVVTPILDPRVQIGDSSVDIRLGNFFVVTKTARLGAIEPFGYVPEPAIERYQETLYIGFSRRLWIHPGTFVLGGTLEYVRLPFNLCAEVTARSSWARLGLGIASAVVVHPGFYGCLALELVNNGNTPVAIHPGDRIGQLRIYEVDPAAAPLAGVINKYQGQILPGYSRLREERAERERSRWLGRASELG